MRALVLSLIVGLSACTGRDAPEEAPAATQRARDSGLGESRLPGASGIRRALRASDSAAARRALEDSLIVDR